MIFFIGIMRTHCHPLSTLLFQFLSHFLPIPLAALFIFSAAGATHKKEKELPNPQAKRYVKN
ncbi:MAG: hypothetical protein ACOCP4_02680 [Candidatus Woesearchaeota archaeon]